MPKRKRITSNDAVQVLEDKDIKKLQKLIAQTNADEIEDHLTNLDTITTKSSQIKIFEDDEEAVNFEDICYGDDEAADNAEDKEEWNKFFKTELNKDFKEKLTECKDIVAEEMSEFCGSIPGDLQGIDDMDELPEEMKSHLKLLKSILRNYRSGPLPKTVKVLPSLPGWDGILEMLDPMTWSRHAHMQVTKVFASKGHEPSLHYFQNYLLPAVQEDIACNKRLSTHLFEALMSASFRQQELVSGIFLPWIRSEMTKVEGIVLAHFLKKTSLKARYGAVCIALVCAEEFSIPRSLVVESLLGKKYNMPERAISSLVSYFVSMDRDCSKFYTMEDRLPVSWFKSLVLFLELYRDGVLPHEREQLVKLCRRQQHPFFSEQIRAYLQMIPTERKI